MSKITQIFLKSLLIGIISTIVLVLLSIYPLFSQRTLLNLVICMSFALNILLIDQLKKGHTLK